MEQSALVIIDYNKAIENGYIKRCANAAERESDNVAE